ncbi:VOC family protein [Kitasatospora paranensis]|uniref:VOC family protein n=1 Tax=Kitasatospora paranensis TaxID=258053 RepID=A0ABW2FXX8_9ACTN
MDALHPRLLVSRFAETFRFYEAVLPELTGAQLMKGDADGPYAHWDVDGQGVLALFDRAAMAGALGPDVMGPDAVGSGLRAGDEDGGQGDGRGVMFVCRVDDVEVGHALCLRHGAISVAAPTDRPAWGPALRTAHLRDPEGTLIELQSY